MIDSTLQKKRADAIRMLSLEAVCKAKSGHPGMPMGMADIAEVLWYNHLNHSAAAPQWINRDRFVLSNGHGSMLLYSLLYFSGFDLHLEDIKAFRQLHSKTPGHPEYGLTVGVETTTGPLGQGIANAVGFALSQQQLAAVYNRPGFPIFDHYTYVFAGDGCLMEGISHEAAALAGRYQLEKLIIIWDQNDISIDGKIADWAECSVADRFRSYGFSVIEDIDGHDAAAIDQAIRLAKNSNQPSLLCMKTQIGFGSPDLAGTAKIHGAPLSPEQVNRVKEQLGWEAAPFETPQAILDSWQPAHNRCKQAWQHWQALYAEYQQTFPELAAQLEKQLATVAKPDLNWNALIEHIAAFPAPIASRKASQKTIGMLLNEQLPLWGGSADLSESNGTLTETHRVNTPTIADGNYLHYGVREFGMAAIMNGIALYGGHIPYGGTFLVFSDYLRNALRLSALMHQRVIYVLTHDSIGLGEDGPTHQPIEHLWSLRLIPNVQVIRPADNLETAIAWKLALGHQGPTVLALSRQNVETQAPVEQTRAALIERGGYCLRQSNHPEVSLIATGSEVQTALAVADRLEADHQLSTQVSSIPSLSHFLAQDAAYQEAVLGPENALRIIIEAGSTLPWYAIAGNQAIVLGLDSFGDSAPAKDVYSAHKLDVESIVRTIRERQQFQHGSV